jgi:hypothetical protein
MGMYDDVAPPIFAVGTVHADAVVVSTCEREQQRHLSLTTVRERHVEKYQVITKGALCESHNNLDICPPSHQDVADLCNFHDRIF